MAKTLKKKDYCCILRLTLNGFITEYRTEPPCGVRPITRSWVHSYDVAERIKDTLNAFPELPWAEGCEPEAAEPEPEQPRPHKFKVGDRVDCPGNGGYVPYYTVTGLAGHWLDGEPKYQVRAEGVSVGGCYHTTESNMRPAPLYSVGDWLVNTTQIGQVVSRDYDGEHWRYVVKGPQRDCLAALYPGTWREDRCKPLAEVTRV